MKPLFVLFFLLGAAQLASASSAGLGSLWSKLDLGAFEGLAFGSIQGSFGLLGALCFALAVLLRLKRPGR